MPFAQLEMSNVFEKSGAIQRAAKVKPEGRTGVYGFHDFRRAFATMNAETLTPDALQLLMQHKACTTTQKYINMARQLNPAVQKLYVPELARISHQPKGFGGMLAGLGFREQAGVAVEG
jgi:integrase